MADLASGSTDASGALTMKCVLVGDGTVGKTSLIVSYTTNGYPQEYIPTAFDTYSVLVRVDDQPINLQLCDTAGQAEFDSLRPLCYPNADVILLCFSVVSPASFANVRDFWMDEIHKFAPADTPVLLVGTQTDLRQDSRIASNLAMAGECPVNEGEATKLASLLGTTYMECSALTRYNLKQVFDEAILAALSKSSSEKVRRNSETLVYPVSAKCRSFARLKQKLLQGSIRRNYFYPMLAGIKSSQNFMIFNNSHHNEHAAAPSTLQSVKPNDAKSSDNPNLNLISHSRKYIAKGMSPSSKQKHPYTNNYSHFPDSIDGSKSPMPPPRRKFSMNPLSQAELPPSQYYPTLLSHQLPKSAAQSPAHLFRPQHPAGRSPGGQPKLHREKRTAERTHTATMLDIFSHNELHAQPSTPPPRPPKHRHRLHKDESSQPKSNKSVIDGVDYFAFPESRSDLTEKKGYFQGSQRDIFDQGQLSTTGASCLNINGAVNGEPRDSSKKVTDGCPDFTDHSGAPTKSNPTFRQKFKQFIRA